MLTRRHLFKTLCAIPVLASFPRIGIARNVPAFAQLKAGYAQRLKKILANGKLPYIDIESSCNSSSVDIDAIARTLRPIRGDSCQLWTWAGTASSKSSNTIGTTGIS